MCHDVMAQQQDSSVQWLHKHANKWCHAQVRMRWPSMLHTIMQRCSMMTQRQLQDVAFNRLSATALLSSCQPLSCSIYLSVDGHLFWAARYTCKARRGCPATNNNRAVAFSRLFRDCLTFVLATSLLIASHFFNNSSIVCKDISLIVGGS